MHEMLVVNQLKKVFAAEKKGGSDFTAVNGISFDLKKGEILGLLGPNGAGKSTTIAMLLGVLTPTSGSITYFGKDFYTHRSQILEKVTFASTYIKMPWRLTVMENLRVNALFYGVSGKTFEKRVKHFLEFFEVWNQKDKTMGQLSAGQITRVMLAKAFIPHPEVVLLDEPTASLDPDIAHQVRQFITRQQKEFGTSIVYTSHNMDEVADICDRVVFLRKGEIQAIDAPEKLAESVSTTTMHLLLTDGMKRAQKVAQQFGFITEESERYLSIHCEEQRIAEFLAKLAAAGVEYSQISIDKPTLEDYFLSMSKK